MNHRKRRSEVNHVFKVLFYNCFNARIYMQKVNIYISPCLAEKPGKVQFQAVPTDISSSTTTTDDAYDFNTDFK